MEIVISIADYELIQDGLRAMATEIEDCIARAAGDDIPGYVEMLWRRLSAVRDLQESLSAQL